MKKILGLDIGTNSVGWALIEQDFENRQGKILGLGSRIIPLDGDSLSKFENGGQVETKAASRRMLRGARRLKQRYKLRRNRIIKVFKILGWVDQEFPENFKLSTGNTLSFNINQYLPFSELTKQGAFEAFGSENISEDWIVYFLRNKALKQEITLSELARIIYMLNQRRGFKSSRKEAKIRDESEEEKWPKLEKWIEIFNNIKIEELAQEKDKTLFKVIAGNYSGEVSRKHKPDWENKPTELEVTRKTTKNGEKIYSFKVPESTDWEKQKSGVK